MPLSVSIATTFPAQNFAAQIFIIFIPQKWQRMNNNCRGTFSWKVGRVTSHLNKTHRPRVAKYKKRAGNMLPVRMGGFVYRVGCDPYIYPISGDHAMQLAVDEKEIRNTNT